MMPDFAILSEERKSVGEWALFRVLRSRWRYGCCILGWVPRDVIREMAQWCADTFYEGNTCGLEGVLDISNLSDRAADWHVHGQTDQFMVECCHDKLYIHFAEDHHRVAFLLRWSDLHAGT